MKIAVRMDDITPDMDWVKFEKFIMLFEEFNIKPLIGVVPDNQDKNLSKNEKRDDFWEYVKKLQNDGYSVAMHGYQHNYLTKKGGNFPINNFSEFVGLSYERQLEMIQQGKRKFQENGVDTDIFMAPAHAYDNNTLRALKECGFIKITDGFGNKPYIWKQITFYPISFRLKNSLKKKKGYSTMVIHSNTVNEDDMKYYRKVFKEYKEDFISYTDYLDIEAKHRSIFKRIGEWILAKVKFLLRELKG